jgi:hypothetical protein
MRAQFNRKGVAGYAPTLTAGFLLALALTFNACSGGDDNTPLSSSSGGNPNNGVSSSSNGYSSGNGGYAGSHEYTETFAIEINESDSTFTYIEEDYECMEGGILEKEYYRNEAAYSISNNVLALWMYAYERDSEDSRNDSLHFNGTSNSIIGTWTRIKNDSYSKMYYDIVKAEISQNTFKITSDVCFTDKVKKVFKIIDCNTFEVSKENEKATQKLEWSSQGELIAWNFTYNGITCKEKKYTEAEMRKACTEAWTKYNDEEYYWDILNADFYDCTKNFPSWVFSDGDESEESAMLAKKSNVKVPKKKNLFSILQKK